MEKTQQAFSWPDSNDGFEKWVKVSNARGTYAIGEPATIHLFHGDLYMGQYWLMPKPISYPEQNCGPLLHLQTGSCEFLEVTVELDMCQLSGNMVNGKPAIMFSGWC